MELEQQWFRECIVGTGGGEAEATEGVTWIGPYDPFEAGDSIVTSCRGIYDRL